VDRLACIDVFALPLQLLQRDKPQWRDRPLVVLDRPGPQATITWAGERARRYGVLPGMRFSAALSLTHELEAGIVEASRIAHWIVRLGTTLREYAPQVEPNLDEPGVFWLGLRGMELLWPDLRAWMHTVQQRLAEMELQSTVVVGFTRFGTYATARQQRKSRIFESAAAEKAALQAVSLNRLAISARIRERLARLAVYTLEDLVQLPAGALLKRYGRQIHRIHALASGVLQPPLRAAPPPPATVRQLALTTAEPFVSGVLFLLKKMLHPLIDGIAARNEAVAALAVTLHLEDAPLHRETIRPAAPTCDLQILLDLVRLRLEAHGLNAEVESLDVQVTPARVHFVQQELFAQKCRRDLQAANRALARVRAELGERTVCRAALHPAHLPEARFSWEPLAELTLPCLERSPGAAQSLSRDSAPDSKQDSARNTPQGTKQGSVQRLDVVTPTDRPLLVRRFYTPARHLCGRRCSFSSAHLAAEEAHRGEPLADIATLRLEAVPSSGGGVKKHGKQQTPGPGQPPGAVQTHCGPYLISGGWWHKPVFREYHFVETAAGDLLWVYYDRRTRCWYLCGKVA
jgi:protein ImuB